MQIPIINGITTDENSDFRTAYPRNYIPIPKQQGISNGYLRPSDGVIQFAKGPGVDRGGEKWRDTLYRVMGTKLVSVSEGGVVTTLGELGGSDEVRMDYSFDRLAMNPSQKFFYWDGSTLTQVTDPDLGPVIDFIWVDGYWMTTDGENLVVTELQDPTQVDPLKYGSSEVDPDPVLALLKLRNEAVALNRHTIEFFKNRSVAGFPFQRISGAQIKKGVIGTRACAIYNEAIAFVGSGRDEAPAVYLGNNGSYVKLSTREIEQQLENYTEEVLSGIVCEVHLEAGLNQFHILLPDQTIVYDAAASAAVKEPVWFYLTSGTDSLGQNRAKNRVWCYDKYIVGDPQSSNLGYLTDTTSQQWGEDVTWEFVTGITYNEGRRAIFHELELVGLPGRAELGQDPTVGTSYSVDGTTWSNPFFTSAGEQGERNIRLTWWNQGILTNYRMQRFQGDSSAHLAVARLEARLEGLAY